MQQAGYYTPAPSGAHPVAHRESDIDERKAALFDMGYLVVALNLYVASFFVPLLGLVAGLMLMLGGAHERTRRVGRLCLIIAGVSLVLWIGLAVLWFVVLAAAASV